jgi:predicted unusual protein kinase regulating ubiquinone biosynthesis (AarF/ABC1/UbiB family)
MARFGLEAKVRIAVAKDPRAVGRWLVEELSKLGPAYVKCGQFLSTRSDLLEKDITDELSRLQDDIRPVPFDAIEKILREDLPDAFEFVEPTCIASASIGQVHKGRLKSGQSVAIKIQKPGVVESIVQDIQAIKFINAVYGRLQPGKGREISNFIRQYETFLSSEIDYVNELKNMVDFNETKPPGIVIPGVYRKASSKRVLTMQLVESVKITDLEGLRRIQADPKALAKRLVDVFLRQITTTGLVHCDPHPGNIGVNAARDIVLYDFGNVVRLTESFRMRMRDIVFAVYQRDVDEFVDLLVSLRVLDAVSDRDKLEIKAFFEYFFDYLETLDFKAVRESLVNNDLLRRSKLTLKVNQDFLSLVRVFSLLDGTCTKLDPEFEYNAALQPYVTELFGDINFLDTIARKDFKKLQGLPRSLQVLDRRSIGLDNKLERSDESLNVVKAIVVGGLVMDAMSQTYGEYWGLLGIAVAIAVLKM